MESPLYSFGLAAVESGQGGAGGGPSGRPSLSPLSPGRCSSPESELTTSLAGEPPLPVRPGVAPPTLPQVTPLAGFSRQPCQVGALSSRLCRGQPGPCLPCSSLPLGFQGSPLRAVPQRIPPHPEGLQAGDNLGIILPPMPPVCVSTALPAPASPDHSPPAPPLPSLWLLRPPRSP